MEQINELCKSFIEFFEIVLDKYVSAQMNPRREWEYFKNLIEKDVDICRIKSYVRVLKASSEDAPVLKKTRAASTSKMITLDSVTTFPQTQKPCVIEKLQPTLVEKESTNQFCLLGSKMNEMFKQNNNQISLLLKTNRISCQTTVDPNTSVTQPTSYSRQESRRRTDIHYRGLKLY